MRKFSDGEICKWVLNIGGKDIQLAQGSDSDLDLTLLRMLNNGELNGLEKLAEFKNEDAIFYSKTALEEADERVQQIQSDLKGAQKLKTKVNEIKDIYGNTVEEVETYLAIDDSIGVTSVLHHVDIDGEPLVKPMDKKAFKKNRTSDYAKAEEGQFITYGGQDIAKLIKTNSAEKLVEMEMNSWEDLTEMGTKIHAVFEAIFSGETPKYEEIFKKKDGDPDVSEEVFNQLVADVKAFKKAIQQKWGENCKFYPEQGIISKNLSPEMLMKLQQSGKNSINGIIDLLVVDEHGAAHIIDYKVSRKLVGTWDGFDGMDKTWDYDKKQSASYQTELYKMMLKQYGFTSIDTYIVPIKTDLSYKDSKDPFKVTALNGVRFATNFSTSESLDTPIIANPGLRNAGKHASIISRNFFIPKTIMTSSDASAVAKAHETFFPKHGAISRLQDKQSDIAYYRGQKRFVRELKPGEYKYDKEDKRFMVFLPGYHKKAEYVSTEDEVTNILTQYIEHRSEMQTTKYLSFADAIQNIKDGTADITSLIDLGGKGAESAIQTHFARYLRNDWSFVPDEGANSIGIFMFTKNNKCELVCLTDTVLGKNMSDFGQKGSLGFWKGTSILGKTISDKNIDKRRVFDALSENIEAMKVMSFVSLHPELFERTRIAEIKVINPYIGQMDSKFNSSLIYNFNKLVAENPNCGVDRVKSNLFLDDKVAAVEGTQEWLPEIKINFANPKNDANFYTER